MLEFVFRFILDADDCILLWRLRLVVLLDATVLRWGIWSFDRSYALYDAEGPLFLCR